MGSAHELSIYVRPKSSIRRHANSMEEQALDGTGRALLVGSRRRVARRGRREGRRAESRGLARRGPPRRRRLRRDQLVEAAWRTGGAGLVAAEDKLGPNEERAKTCTIGTYGLRGGDNRRTAARAVGAVRLSRDPFAWGISLRRSSVGGGR